MRPSAPDTQGRVNPGEPRDLLLDRLARTDAASRRPAGRPRRTFRRRGPLTLPLGDLLLALVAGGNVFAVHDQDFELDGNALDSPAGPPDDWENVFNNTDSAVVSTFVTDPLGGVNDPDEIFIGGGSKDDLDICEPNLTTDEWSGRCHDRPVVARDGQRPRQGQHRTRLRGRLQLRRLPDRGGGFGDPNNDPDLCLYFGLDRFANNGDAQVGFWFFQSEHAQ